MRRERGLRHRGMIAGLGWAVLMACPGIAAGGPQKGETMTKPITVTVGQNEGDIRGNDDRAIQAAADYVTRLGGGVLQILPGEYTMHNALHLHSGLTVRGSGANTVLKKAPSFRSKIVQEVDWYDREVPVADASGFRVGGGVMLQSKGAPSGSAQSLQMTVVRIDGNVLTVNDRINKNFWTQYEPSAATLHPLIRGERVNDVRVEHIVLDGDREHNEEINGNYAGAIFMQWCDRVVIEGVTCRNYNGDGISLQVCDDAQVLNCVSDNNANLGFHPGSGCMRPIFRDCVSRGNGLGFFFCWGVRNGLVENCTFTENKDYGVSYGHRDTDNLVRNCKITKNGKVGVLFRKEEVEYFGGHRNTLENCEITDNGAAENGCGVDIRGNTHDLMFKGCKIGDTGQGLQKIGIRMSAEASRIHYEGSEFFKLQKDVERLLPEAQAEKK